MFFTAEILHFNDRLPFINELVILGNRDGISVFFPFNFFFVFHIIIVSFLEKNLNVCTHPDLMVFKYSFVIIRDLHDAEKVAEAVTRALTSKVDRSDRSTTLALANSDVLHQRKMELLDVSQRSARSQRVDSLHGQVGNIIWQW